VKALRFVLVAFAACMFVMPVLAQDTAQSEDTDKWSDLYYVNVPIEKIYPHSLGYMVLYRKNGVDLGRAYLPMEWFTEAGGKGELIRMGPGKTWPYMSIFYEEGQFSHVRLFVRAERSHTSWGMLSSGSQIDDKFAVEELDLEF